MAIGAGDASIALALETVVVDFRNSLFLRPLDGSAGKGRAELRQARFDNGQLCLLDSIV